MEYSTMDELLLNTFAALNEKYTDEYEVRNKARMFDVLMGASKREVEALWDFMNATGARPEPLIDAIARKQAAKV